MDHRARERTPLAIYLEENYCFNLLLFGSSKLEHFHPLHCYLTAPLLCHITVHKHQGMFWDTVCQKNICCQKDYELKITSYLILNPLNASILIQGDHFTKKINLPKQLIKNNIIEYKLIKTIRLTYFSIII